MLPSTEWAALRTVSRCSRRSCKEEVGVVVPKRWPASVHLALLDLALLMPCWWRARLTVDVTLSALFRESFVGLPKTSSKLR